MCKFQKMTYQERYTELYKKYEEAGERLMKATQNIAFTNGFGDKQEIAASNSTILTPTNRYFSRFILLSGNIKADLMIG